MKREGTPKSEENPKPKKVTQKIGRQSYAEFIKCHTGGQVDSRRELWVVDSGIKSSSDEFNEWKRKNLRGKMFSEGLSGDQ